jgi:hypothetical protein
MRDRRRLAWFALAYGVLHHLGVGASRLGEVGDTGTRWADWLDLAVPPLVLGSAALVLASSRTSGRRWLLFGAGAVLYTEGHGIHLAANSIANVAPGDVAHLWDEPVGHHIWYLGAAVVMAAVMWAASERPIPRGPIVWSLVALVGVTYATNALEGGTAVLALVTGVLFVVAGARHRTTAAVLAIPTFALAMVIILAYGAIHGGFPQPSDVGWSLL